MKSKKSPINFFKKPLFAQILFLVALIGIISFFKLSFNFSNNNDDNNSGLATLAINFDTEKRFFEGEVVKDMTILDALSAAVSVGKIEFNFAIDKSGNVNILEIDSHLNGVGNKYFVFYLNSKKVVPQELNKQIVHSGDKIEIRNE